MTEAGSGDDGASRAFPSSPEAEGPFVAETHISTVFFTTDRAYKLLKPIRTSFLDQSSIQARLQAVNDELRLNRRLAPDVYLGTSDVVENDSVVDRMLVMRRLSASQRLTTMIERGEDIADCIRAIARTVAVFHQAQPPQLEARDVAGREAVQRNWHDNFSDIQPVVGTVLSAESVERVRSLVDNYLDHRDVLFDQRLAGGFVRDGHGDLTAEDTFCLADGPRILDCLAFDPTLRVADVLLDVAFLAMDLERLSGAEVAKDFLSHYAEFSNEHHPSSLARHFIAYRASVRAKVAAIRFGQGDHSQAPLIRQYHDLCLGQLEEAAVNVIMIGGTPGTGKSLLAQGLSNACDYMVLSTDELRKDLAGLGHLDRSFSSTDQGIYAPQLSELTYAELVGRAGVLLDRGESVILDASWNRAEHRELVNSLVESKGANLFQIQCVLDAARAKERIASRLEAGTDPSDARPELVDELRSRFETWPQAFPLDTSHSPGDVLCEAIRHVGRR